MWIDDRTDPTSDTVMGGSPPASVKNNLDVEPDLYPESLYKKWVSICDSG